MKLTDKQKKKIIADYVSLQSYTAAGKLNGVSRTTVKRLVDADSGTHEKMRQKKAENTEDVLSYMSEQAEVVKDLIGKYLTALADDDKIAAASIVQIATSMGIVIDKFTAPGAAAKDDRGIRAFLDAAAVGEKKVKELFNDEQDV